MPNQPVPAKRGATQSRLALGAKFKVEPAKFGVGEPGDLTEKEHAEHAAHHSRQSKNLKLPLATRDWHAKRALYHHAHSGDLQGDIEAPDHRTGFKDAPAGAARLAEKIDAKFGTEHDAERKKNIDQAMDESGFKHVVSHGSTHVYSHPQHGIVVTGDHSEHLHHNGTHTVHRSVWDIRNHLVERAKKDRGTK